MDGLHIHVSLGHCKYSVERTHVLQCDLRVRKLEETP